ncbi:uncharacterized protein [Watersipora subatra]|uniref:uncharacterized protein n=1 Tax=Watersipora subatra TaxID=2589382 RepID=UPI00355C1A3C
MATQRCKTEKIDLNPNRVQNPFEHLKRSPGKFDQRVYMEQELFGGNNVRFYRKLYNTQQTAQLTSYDKHINELRKRNTELRAQNGEYTYLKSLRTALHKEQTKRQREVQTGAQRPETPEEVRRRLRIERRSTMTIAEAEEQGPDAENSEAQAKQNEQVGDAAEESSDKQTGGDNTQSVNIAQDENLETDETDSNRAQVEVEKKPKPRPKKFVRKNRPVSPNRLVTLESLSYEIMTNTLPIDKLKRILPEENLPVHEKWPILSNYRKQTILPNVKARKKQLHEDMDHLHKRINEYFGCENFPLWQYKYVPKDYSTKYKLLKAIETEGIHLPTLPKR